MNNEYADAAAKKLAEIANGDKAPVSQIIHFGRLFEQTGRRQAHIELRQAYADPFTFFSRGPQTNFKLRSFFANERIRV